MLMSSPAAPEWELTKENVQPVKRGRPADARGEGGCGSVANKAKEDQRLCVPELLM